MRSIYAGCVRARALLIDDQYLPGCKIWVYTSFLVVVEHEFEEGAAPMMKALLFFLLFYSAQLRPAHGATATEGSRTNRPRLEYILVTANSPDCSSSQSYPAPLVQFRQTMDSKWTTLSSKTII